VRKYIASQKGKSVATLSYKYRINPNHTQAVALGEMLADFCQLYNAGLEQRIQAWRRQSVTVTYKMQADELKAVRCAAPELARWSFSAEQQVLRRVDKTFKAFFARGFGFPRFRASARFHAAEFRVGDGLTLRKSDKLGVVGVQGEIKVRWHRDLPSTPTSAILTRQGGKWYVVFHVEVAPVERAGPDSVGIDVGLSSLVTLSNGESVARPGWSKRAERELRRRQRALARCKRGSKRRAKRKAALAKFHDRVGNRRRDHLHKLSRDLVDRFGRIAIEDLNVQGLARSTLAKHVVDASWAQLAAMLDYKAANAGVELVRVDPRGTSQTCPECGTVAAKTLAERIHRCPCGCVIDRDVAAAMVVHFRAFGFWPGTGLGSLSERVAA
jgi:putative transposase